MHVKMQVFRLVFSRWVYTDHRKTWKGNDKRMLHNRILVVFNAALM